MGPLRLRSAVRCIVQHRPSAQTVEVRLRDGRVLGETEIEAIYAAASLPGNELARTTLSALEQPRSLA